MLQKQLLPIHSHLSSTWEKFHGSDRLLQRVLDQKKIKAFSNRKILTDVLKNQLKGYGKENLIERLEKENCFTVTTGHQIGLLGGPMFFFSKIMTTIRLAEELRKADASADYLPVFWMATEDHDKEEIRSVQLFGKQISWETAQEGAVGRFTTDDLSDFLNEIDALKGNFSHADEVMGIIQKAYAPSKTLAAATRDFVYGFFDDVVVIDGDDAELKSLFKPVILSEIVDGKAFPEVLKKNEELVQAGFQPQVHPREINFFYLEKGSRKRIVQDQEGYALHDGNKKWTKDAIREEVENHPENFSPNVLLRPLYQETILPNLAYIGGPGELSYWVQLTGVFKAYGVIEPVQFPRNSILPIEPGIQGRLEKLNMSADQFFASEQDLIRDFLAKNAGEEMDLSSFKNPTANLFESLEEKAAKVDPTLKPAVSAEHQKFLKFLENLEGKLRKAEKAKHETTLSQIKNVKEKLFPGGVPLERSECMLALLWKYGPSIVPAMMTTIDPLDQSYHIISLQ
jgi:bacillithiol biosynthesis cysteine-adding enzyme BshC